MEMINNIITGSGSVEIKESIRSNTVKLVVGGIFFLILSIGVFIYQFNKLQVDQSFYLWKRFEWGYLFLMFLVVPLDPIAGSMRIWIISRVIHPGVTYWTCFKSGLTNIGTAMLTPSQTGGGLGQIYILCRGGVTIGSATAICFISFTGTMLVLLGIGLYSLFFTDIGNMEDIFRYAVMIFLFITLSMLLIALFPGHLRRIIRKTSIAFGNPMSGSSPPQNLCSSESEDKSETYDHCKRGLSERIIELFENYHNSLRCYLQVGKINFICVLVLSFAFLFFRSLAAFLCLRFLGIHQPSLSHIVEIQLVLLFFIYFAPTPGGAGISEVMSLTIMSSFIPMELAPYYNLFWRTATLYLSGVAGLIFLSHAVVVQGKETLVNIGSRHVEDI